MSLIALAIATLIPLLVLVVIRALDLYQTGAFRIVLLCLAWGGIAYAGPYFINRFVYFRGLVDIEDLPRYFAPVAEEILKALILIYLVRRTSFTYFVDGAIYGFAVGIGFAVFENYEYILQNPYAGLGTAIARVLSANLMHASASSLVGVTLGLARFRRTAGHFGLLLGGLLLAMALHSLFNNLTTRPEIPGPVLVYSTVIGLGGVGAVAAVIFRGLAEEKAWIAEKLGMADRVTAQEVKVVQRLEDIQEVLAPLKKHFGEAKAEQIEKFLFAQARLGILRKTLEKLPDERMRQAVEAQMSDMRLEMEKTRRLVGSYCMASVRLLFPPETSPFLNRLQATMQARANSGQSSGDTAAQWQRMEDLFKVSSSPQSAATASAGWMSSLSQRAVKTSTSTKEKP